MNREIKIATVRGPLGCILAPIIMLGLWIVCLLVNGVLAVMALFGSNLRITWPEYEPFKKQRNKQEDR